MNLPLKSKRILGINGIGRIGKLTLWNQLYLKHFDGIVINAGREVGKKVEDILHYLTTDTTYNSLDRFLYGYTGKSCNKKILNENECTFEINGMVVKVLKKERNPKNIDWTKEGVRLVVDCTGQFLDPTISADYPKGSIRGHLEAGAEKVIISAPFKIKDSSQKIPGDSAMFVYGVNHAKYDPANHHILSAASCTTTGLAHMMKALLDTKETSHIITASMSTVHASTNNQSILDRPPKAGSKDLRKNRSIFNNIIPTSTGAAIALEEILPEIKKVGFMADSVRVPTNTASLIALNITFRTDLNETGEPIINREFINNIYKNAAQGSQKDLLVFSNEQNVSSDIAGSLAAITIEGHETHTRTGFLQLDVASLQEYGVNITQNINLPVTHAKIFGWYDNEFGSYVNCLSKLTVYVDKNMI
ncbi:glyceraldehyde 3-phosphate dehydrogenase NAD-binding domain-containing protein [Garciella nitratireducens]|uniref:Glyceraldehyde 3-phosphate dehydrogenase n=1 Tax=Garciella nitratireducens DSM 15102 TaxID=1121911 RepID=A0A1T4PWW9_9FIRM|nr:glyceraldehyde 3-phosphate dehydrogenase NAD-binding domain-containing protein [Garciella nitratireducens]RBP45473.1 glyceraldehyde 3-phosphate dehydrogenase [Garciella nitratireducens]SJZ96050.1 glyceraldehyde 3-phosphate dehydrogenase [Garciella nitratireducens DSM 15102]